jgi:DNA-binding MarR family transcriptional regulator
MSATEIPGEAAPTADAPAAAGAPLTASQESTPIHDASTAAGRLGLAFKRAMVAVRRLRGRETHRPGQLSYAQYGLLFGLGGMRESSARDLAEHADLSPATVAQMLEHLEAAGLVTRTRSEQDRRVVLSTLTERGAAVVAERHAQMEPRWRATLNEFTSDELDAAARVLDRLADYFDDQLETGVED